LEIEKIKAQNKENEINWEVSLINAIIATALGVAKALPVIPLSILAGILGGIEIGVIAANKPKTIPLPAASGGFTGKGSVRDATGERRTSIVQLHENEWVAPGW